MEEIMKGLKRGEFSPAFKKKIDFYKFQIFKLYRKKIFKEKKEKTLFLKKKLSENFSFHRF